MNWDKIITCDTECYVNYLLIMFRRVKDGKTIHFEKFNDSKLDTASISNILSKYTILTFNGIGYDMPVVEAALAGFNNETLKKITNLIIPSDEDKKKGIKGLKPWEIRKQFGFRELKIDHIDIMEVAPLKASLKIYAGRLQTKELEDLPIPHDAVIKDSDRPKLIKYCAKDNYNTELIARELETELDLRCDMREEYGVDLRSKSDAQIAETVIANEVENVLGFEPKPSKVKEGTQFNFKAPDFIQFDNLDLQDLLDQYTSLPYTVNKTGHVDFSFKITDEDRFKSGKRKGELPDSKPKLKMTIAGKKYTLGIGGIHSIEKSKAHIAAEDEIIKDIDVASYYPRAILSQGLYPKSIGPEFLRVYEGIVNRRLAAKNAKNPTKKDKVTNSSLKIVINGSFGKFGSKYSILYSPNLMIQVTITGQLSLLMLIERMEAAGISVISANTDGIVVKCKKAMEDKVNEIIEDWEFETGFDLEPTNYEAIYSRDVNNYIAIIPPNPKKNKPRSIKGKGAYADQYDSFYRLRSNPVNEICKQAVKKFLTDSIPVEETIHSCKNIVDFTSIITVNSGAVKEGKLIGKAIRWYYGTYELDAIYRTTGQKVPKSDNGVPLMDIPTTFPNDVDYNWYINEAKRMLSDVGCKL